MQLTACGQELRGNVIILENDLEHKAPDGEVFNIDGIKVEVFEVMGHTVDHVCYIIDDKILFSGDCLAVNENGGHSGIRTDMSKLFAHIDESAVSKPGKPFDPTAPKSIRK